jgi:Mce-associated membrane protein
MLTRFRWQSIGKRWLGSGPIEDEGHTIADEPDMATLSSDPERSADADNGTEHDRQAKGSTIGTADPPNGALHDERPGAEPDSPDVAGEPAPRGIARATTELRVALVAATLIVAVLGALAGYLGYRTYETRSAAHQRELFLQTGRQAAINLTTINYTRADADVARILDSATGTFHDDFQKRAQPFIDVVKQAQSTSQGDVTAAGLESINGDQAQVLVAVSVKTSNAGAPEQQPRGWRIRLNVQKVGDTAKVSDVQFVP